MVMRNARSFATPQNQIWKLSLMLFNQPTHAIARVVSAFPERLIGMPEEAIVRPGRADGRRKELGVP